MLILLSEFGTRSAMSIAINSLLCRELRKSSKNDNLPRNGSIWFLISLMGTKSYFNVGIDDVSSVHSVTFVFKFNLIS